MDDVDDIIDFGLVKSNEINHLIKHAINATTIREKDKFVKSIKESWIQVKNATRVLTESNQKKSSELSTLISRYKNITEIYEAFNNRTSFLDILRSDAPRSKDSLHRQVKEIENMISGVGVLASPNALFESLYDKDDIYNLKMRDLLFSRLEELVYALKKRILVVEESANGCIPVSEKYGTVSNLINFHNKLVEENENLRKEESKYIHIAMVKRRNFNRISPSNLTIIGVMMQAQLDALMQYRDMLPYQTEFEVSSLDFSDVTSAESLIRFHKSDFGTNIDTELVEKLSKTESSSEQLLHMKQVLQTQYMSIEKLLKELSPLRGMKYSFNNENNERIDKLWNANYKLSSQILDMTTKVESTNNEIYSLYYNILRLMKERGYYASYYSCIIHSMLPFINEVNFVHYLTYQNKKIIDSLARVCLLLSLSIYDAERKECSILARYIRKIAPKEEEIRIHEPPPIDQESQETYDQLSDDDSRKFFNFKPLESFKKNKPKRNIQMIENIKNRGEHNKLLYENLFEDSNTLHKLYFMSLAYDLSTYATEDPTDYNSFFSEKINTLFDGAFEDLVKICDDYKNYEQETFSLMQLMNTNILRKELVDKEITADTQPRIVCETQTEEPEPPSTKGRKTALAAKPSPRRKK